MTFLFASIIAGTVFYTLYLKRDFFHPARIYILLYSLLFAVYSLHLCRFQDPWSSTTHMLFWGGVLCFLGGGAILTVYVRNLHLAGEVHQLQVPFVTEKLAQSEHRTDWNWFLKVTFVIFAVFVLTYLYVFLQTGIIPINSDNPNQDRFLYLGGSTFGAHASASGTLVMMLSAEVLFLKHTTRTQKLLALFMFIVSFVLYFTLVTRMPLVRSFIYIAVLYHYIKKEISIRTILFFTLLAVMLFGIGLIIRVDISEFSELAQNLRMNISNKYLLFINPYAYAVNNIWNLDFAFKKFVDGTYAYNFSYGFEFFRGFLSYIRFENPLMNTYNFDTLYNESVTKVSGLNTIIYIWHFYKDFGLFGMFFVSLLLSMAIHTFYFNSMLSPSHFRIAFFGLIISMIFFSFMIPLWSFWNIYYEAAVIMIAHKAVKII
jgi:oligosaccharide repeat unit polymerase